MRGQPATGDLDVEKLRAALLAWYDGAARTLPWRAPPKAARLADPYRVWLSEIMLQQTSVTAVKPYFEDFLARWPDAAALAAAPREAVLSAWAGLGYYARARNLHACAQVLAAEGFPQDEAGLLRLPGVGAYTAAAIAAIALGRPANVVDGNIERVMARLFAVEAPLPAAKAALRALAARFVRDDRPGDWAQALMDLGATLCTPRGPRCGVCPAASMCRARALGTPENYPRRSAKVAKPERRGVAFRLERGGEIWLVRRPDKGLLGGMAALPSTDWATKPAGKQAILAASPASTAWRVVGEVRHVFTHFALNLEVRAANADVAPAGEGWWHARESLKAAGLPTVFAKAAAL